MLLLFFSVNSNSCSKLLVGYWNRIDEATFQQLLVSAPTTRSRALARSSSLPHARDWLNVMPSTSLGLHLHDREFRCCISYWLGVPLHSIPYYRPNASALLTTLETIRSGVAVVVTGLLVTTLFVTSYSPLHRALPSDLQRKSLA